LKRLLASLQDAVTFCRWTGGLARSSLDTPATGWHAVGMWKAGRQVCVRRFERGLSVDEEDLRLDGGCIFGRRFGNRGSGWA